MTHIAVLYADADMRWRGAAVVALSGFTHALTVLRAGAAIDPGVPVLVIWTAHAARHREEARAILRSSPDVVLWRPDGAPAPAWLPDAAPVGPEMPAQSLALMAKFAAAQAHRRAHEPPPRRRLEKLTLVSCIGAGVTLMLAGAGMYDAAGDAVRDRVAAPLPIAELRGTQ